jgi:hypothetical protein
MCQLLEKHESKIYQLTVGIHFYQNHLDFIAAFLDRPTVRFVMDLGGVFHPKLYLFQYGEEGWDCIMGRASIKVRGQCAVVQRELLRSNHHATD